MPIRAAVLALVLLLAVGAPRAARADDEEPEQLTGKEIARIVVRSVRRAVALGPTLGGFSTYGPSHEGVDAGISFGLELELFESNIPTTEDITEIAKQKAKEKLVRVIAERFAGQPIDAETRKRLLRELAEEIKAEVIAQLRARPSVLEQPRFSLPIEASYLFRSADWLARFGVAIGVGPVSIGPTFSVRFGDNTVARLGAEAAIHLLPSPSPRSPVLDVFLRGDFELHKRDTNEDQVVLGVRVLLDLI
jgi:hypothetical protein